MPNQLLDKSLAEWLSYYESLHPVGIDMGLQRVAAVWQRLCVDHSIDKIAKQKIITVAGTNGKGSVCQMLTLLLAGRGERVGVYTSPHIHRFNERIKINAAEVDEKLLLQAFAAIDSARGDITLSYFEATTLVGLLVFAWQQVDFAVLEVGLGGRLDAINIIDADAAIITSISLDHQAFLGNDLAQIAVEKLGVCRPGCPAVYADDVLYDTVTACEKSQAIELLVKGRDYYLDKATVVLNAGSQVLEVPEVIAGLGSHQISNCAAVLVLLARLQLLPDNYRMLLQGFAVAGRLQVISEMPTIIVDVAHNTAAAEALAKYLHNTPCNGKTYAVVAMLSDKDHAEVLAAVSDSIDGVFCAATWGERGFSDTALAMIARNVCGCPVLAGGQLQQALQQAKQQANPTDRIVAFGSFLVAEALIK